MDDFWDIRFNTEELIYGKEPNQFVKKVIDGNKACSVLFVGEGEGRNAIYAAKKGYDVTAVDQSKVAQQKAQARAEQEHVTINYLRSDVLTFQPTEKYDMIVICFLHFLPEQRIKFHHKLKNWLTNVGQIVVEYYDKDQLAFGTGGPKSIDMLYTMKNLQSDFREYGDIQLIRINKFLKEGRYHLGESALIEGIIKP